MIDTYFDLWNEPDASRREELVRSVFTDDGRHVDPLADVQGHDELAAMIAGVQERFPGHALTRTSGVAAHHDVLRYTWRLAAPLRVPGSGRGARPTQSLEHRGPGHLPLAVTRAHG